MDGGVGKVFVQGLFEGARLGAEKWAGLRVAVEHEDAETSLV